MSTHLAKILDYYAASDRMTNIGPSASVLAGLPPDLPGLVSVVQGQLIHIFWAARYGRPLTDDDRATVQVRPLAEKLARIAKVNPAPLTQPRPVGERQVGNCRDFSLFLVSHEPADWLAHAATLDEEIVRYFHALLPLITWLRKALGVQG